MKKIFTTLSLVALMATSASAAITVKYMADPKNPTTLENNAVITLKGEDFEDFSDLFGYTSFEASANLQVDGAAPIQATAVTNNKDFQFCTVVCLDWTPDGNLFTASSTEASAPFMIMNHLKYEDETTAMTALPDTADDYMTITLKDASGAEFKVTIEFKGNAGVNGIFAGDAEVVAVYDMQGRRVADDFKGLGIVLTSDGKAAKKIFK